MAMAFLIKIIKNMVVEKPDLGVEFDEFDLKRKYNEDTLTVVESYYFVQKCMNIGSAALEVLKFLHIKKKLQGKFLLESFIHSKYVPMPGKDEWRENNPILDPYWILAPGITHIIKYLHDEMKLKSGSILTIPYFNIHLITASGNVELIKYLYENGTRSTDFYITGSSGGILTLGNGSCSTFMP